MNKNINKPKILLIFKLASINGGPFVSSQKIYNNLKNKINFQEFFIPKDTRGIINIKLITLLFKAIKDFKPDIIHFPGLEVVGFQIILLKLFFPKVKFLLHVHGSSLEAIIIKKTIVKKFLLYLFEYFTLIFSDYIIFVSRNIKDKVIKRYKYNKSNISLVYNIVQFSNPMLPSQKIRDFISKSKSENKFILLSVARLIYDKGADLLHKFLESSNNLCSFIVIGTGDYEHLFYNYPNILYLRYVDPKYMQFVFSNSDVFVLFSRHETFGMVVAEAGYYGNALYVLKNEGTEEIFNETRINLDYNKLIVEEHEINFREIINILKSNNLLQIKKENSEKFRFLYSTKSIVSQILKIYERLLNNV
jgi:glycosyltransferase involved in cell wall biosynthesis